MVSVMKVYIFIEAIPTPNIYGVDFCRLSKDNNITYS